MEITFHFGAAGHPISWILHAVYGSHYGVALAGAHTWHERMIASARNGTPPGGQFVIEVKMMRWFGPISSSMLIISGSIRNPTTAPGYASSSPFPSPFPRPSNRP